jgi:L-lactate dehydrogenase complex protein LldG
MNQARDEILARIQQTCPATAQSAAASYARIERRYQQSSGRSREQILALLTERLMEYDAHVYRTRETEISSLCAEILGQRNARRIVVPQDLPSAWQTGAKFFPDQDFDAHTLNSFDGVMTAATLAIAETGTIVLQNAQGQGRRAITLVPDYHLCIVREQDVVETVVEGMRFLENTRQLPTTFFSGPSATADIEMTRIKGVHGPRFVDVVILSTRPFAQEFAN